MAETGEISSRHKTLEEIIEMLSAALRTADRGEVASLRRLSPEHPDSPAFWRYVVNLISPEWPLTVQEESCWAAIISSMARMLPFPHQKGRSVGKVLAEQGFAEQRLLKLLRIEGPGLWTALRRLSIFLASRGASIDWVTLSRLILVRDEARSEEIRRSIARDYYWSLERQDKGGKG